ncbi:F0F1 ATP synthase subunit gamma [Pseudoclavibacter caeni]|jgi:F-type H+-transporting ATPase subunit gamma|uniref:ATP synthase gamma chain n=1 Tax=Pseudoclavibacter caeni TaxID=908846 RepID=A0A7C8BNP7_9MICO|nr:F0F1 ATP synthase subunit gamma [Pseudoclavibacter caeni]KAB1632420.1 F0F1 ATP synthase subunit gamma [Pseudoclavibacter caeni]NYJ97671.1 F-type H+-transporting ATPase subunit gamma [Pseudoclavibacter caeni]
MGAQLRVYKQKIKSAQTTKKITRAMELIAASRIQKAQTRASAARPYDEAITRAVGAVAALSTDIDHPLLRERPAIRRSAIVVLASDRGLAGAFSSAILKETDRLANLLRQQGREVDFYLVGRKAVGYFQFRDRPFVRSWTGDTDMPTADVAHEIGEAVVESYLRGGEAGGVDEIHLVYTRFVNRVTQRPDVLRLLPLQVVEGEAEPRTADSPLYEFEPAPEEVLELLLPRYLESRIYHARLESAASEHASRQKAMKAASDNADKLIRSYSTLMNNARQAEITQQISEIVGGADALVK